VLEAICEKEQVEEEDERRRKLSRRTDGKELEERVPACCDYFEES
jgi:hypothetical protein